MSQKHVRNYMIYNIFTLKEYRSPLLDLGDMLPHPLNGTLNGLTVSSFNSTKKTKPAK